MKRGICLLVLGMSGGLGAEPVNFKDHVLPIFKQSCNKCHNPDKMKADLDLTSVAGILKGSSGGEVVRVGTPDSSVLYQAMNHEEDFEPMPPKKPKLDEKTLAIVRDWIAGGMIEHAGGESGLREVSFEVAAGSIERPEEVAVPVGLAAGSSKSGVPVLAVAASPWADVYAVAGHREILMYGPSEAVALAEGFEPVAKDDLAGRMAFDDLDHEGVTGGAYESKGEAVPFEMEAVELDEGFTLAMWLRPSPKEEQKGTVFVFGQGRMKFLIEASGDDWKFRVNVRDRKNRSLWFGRVGTFRGGVWSHVAMTFTGKEFVTYLGGVEVARQAVDEEFEGFRESDEGFAVGGVMKEGGYRGGMDEVRFYARALGGDEVLQITENVAPKLELVGAMPFEMGAIHELGFSPNGSLLLAAGGKGAHSGAVNLYDVKSGKLEATVGDEQDVVLTADVSADHQQVALGGPSKRVKIFNTENGKLMHRIEKHTDWVTAVKFSPDGSLLASGDRNGAVHVWETKSGGIVFSLSEHKEGVTDIAWRGDGEVLATTGEDGKLVLWSMKDGFPLRSVKAHEERTSDRYTRNTGALDVAYLPSGGLVTAGRDRALRLWKTDGKKLKEWKGMTTLPIATAVTHDGSRALTGHGDGRVLLWDLFSGTSVELAR